MRQSYHDKGLYKGIRILGLTLFEIYFLYVLLFSADLIFGDALVDILVAVLGFAAIKLFDRVEPYYLETLIHYLMMPTTLRK